MNRTVMTRMSDDEVKLIDEASKIERRSRCSFIAKASIDRANELIAKIGK